MLGRRNAVFPGLVVWGAMMLLALPAVTAESPPTCGGSPATILGTNGDDLLIGTPGPDTIVGRGGNDTIDGRGGDDKICGGAGDDLIVGRGGHDLIFGGPGSDNIQSGTGNDVVHGGGGRDTVRAGRGDDRVHGNRHRDVINGGPGDDIMWGDRGRDVLLGAGGPGDMARGGPDRDRCFAEAEFSCERVGRLWLHPNGLGPVVFGTSTTAALAELDTFASPPGSGPDDDSGWVSSHQGGFGVCPGLHVRGVEWGHLRAMFFRDAPDADGEFFTWVIVDWDGTARDLKRQTVRGLEWGDSISSLRLIYSEATISFDEIYGWSFRTHPWPDGMWGLLTGGDEHDTIAVLQGGPGCGE